MLKKNEFDLIVLSHLRWDFVFQRPQHLLTRFAKHSRVFFVEEPVFGEGPIRLSIESRQNGVRKVVPHLPQGLSEAQIHARLEELLDQLVSDEAISDYALWYYTPMAIPFTRHLKPRTIIYDCMDELSLFKGAHPHLLEYEEKLLSDAALVFTGGQSLYEFKKARHPNVHAFPSSIDYGHFSQARQTGTNALEEPRDQRDIQGPRLGFFGVIDERMDLKILEGMARARPDWQLVFLGPVVKIHPDTLPRLPNIHYLGQKCYQELPAYIAGWDVALMPFALNDSTRFISPTKTPEYLAAGKPVVSTPIRDVVRPYGDLDLVTIGADAPEFVKAVEKAFIQAKDPAWQNQVDQFLSRMSWDKTWREMAELVAHAGSVNRVKSFELQAS